MNRLFGNLVLFLTASVSFLACNVDQEGFQKTDSGLLYKVIESGEGEVLPEVGDILIMDINYRNHKDSVLFDSKTKSDSFSVVLKEPTFVGGVEEGFAMMHEGDSYQFKVSADSIFLITFFNEKLPEFIEKGSMLKFQVKLHRIIRKSVADSISREQDIALRRQEFDRIERYLKQEKMDVMPTENGAYIKTLVPGNGIFASPGDSVSAYYTGRTLDGEIFDEVASDTIPFTFILGSNKLLSGWNEAVPYLDEGSKSRVVIPSDLAYGANGYGQLPGYATLVFDIEIKKIIKKK